METRGLSDDIGKAFAGTAVEPGSRPCAFHFLRKARWTARIASSTSSSRHDYRHRRLLLIESSNAIVVKSNSCCRKKDKAARPGAGGGTRSNGPSSAEDRSTAFEDRC